MQGVGNTMRVSSAKTRSHYYQLSKRSSDKFCTQFEARDFGIVVDFRALVFKELK